MPPRARLASARDQKLAEIRQKRNEAQAQLQALRTEQKKDTHLHAIAFDAVVALIVFCIYLVAKAVHANPPKKY